MSKSLFLALLALMIMRSDSTAKPHVAPTHTNVRYGAHAKELINVWSIESEHAAGVLLDIHGGGWMGGKKAETMHKNHQILLVQTLQLGRLHKQDHC